MKTAYELAMERLNKSSPSVKLSAEQKRELADLDSRYEAKIAEREIYTKDEIAKASAQGDPARLVELEQRLAHERQSLLAELEAKKEKVRNQSR